MARKQSLCGQCGEKAYCRDMCRPHYGSWRRNDSADVFGYCEVDSCKRPKMSSRLCKMHHERKAYGSLGPDDHVRVRRGFHYVKGYKILWIPDHPNASSKGSIAEHVVVMTEKIGRPLIAPETVHHRNGIRDDNRPENLELWSGNHPPGARVADHIEWALAILDRYGSDKEKWASA